MRENTDKKNSEYGHIHAVIIYENGQTLLKGERRNKSEIKKKKEKIKHQRRRFGNH